MTAQDSSEQNDRVAKVLARAGVASRREVERLIEEGRVAINGQTLTTPAVKVAPGDILTVDGEVVGGKEPTRVFRYHKPVGLLTSHNDPAGRPTVFDALPDGLPRVISIGRLDINSEGLLLLTNDGELSRALELPSSGWVRRYRARAFGYTTQEKLDRLKKGITLESVEKRRHDAPPDKRTADPDRAANARSTLPPAHGTNREVRRVLEAIGLKVNRLLRLSYGPFSLGTLAAGEVEEVGPRVIRELLADFVPPANMPTGTAVQFRTALSAGRRSGAEDGVGGAAPPPKPHRTVLRPGQESGELKGERQVKKPGWAKAKPKKPGGLRTPKKAAPAAKAGPKKHWSETPKGARPAGAARPERAARPEGPAKPRTFTKPSGTATPAAPRGTRPTGGPRGPRAGGPGKRK